MSWLTAEPTQEQTRIIAKRIKRMRVVSVSVDEHDIAIAFTSPIGAVFNRGVSCLYRELQHLNGSPANLSNGRVFLFISGFYLIRDRSARFSLDEDMVAPLMNKAIKAYERWRKGAGL